MPISLQAAQQLSQSRLTNFVIDEFRKSALMDLLTFDNTVKPQGGKSLAYVYNRVKTLPTAAVRAINSEYVPQEADTEQITVNLKVLGGSFQVDRVLAANEEGVVDLVQFELQQKTNATIALFHDLFINGDSAANAAAFDGLNKALTGSSTELTPAEVIDLGSSAKIDANWKIFLDHLRKLKARLDGAPGVLLMHREMFAVFQSVMDRAGINLSGKDNYGDEALQWGSATVMALGDKPGTSDPIIADTSIYMARLGLDGMHGVTPEGDTLVKTYLPDMKQPGAVKLGEVEFPCAMALKATRAAGVLRNVQIG